MKLYHQEREKDWESQMNRPNNELHAAHINTGVIQEWPNEDEPVSVSDNYEKFHSSGEPIQVQLKEKFRHQHIHNAYPDLHDHTLSYRAESERHSERFVGELKRH